MTHSNLRHLERKIIQPDNREALKRHINGWKFAGRQIVFTNGCFDILHAGHIDFLARASDLGEILIVGLNTDDSVRKIKGKHRPINDQNARAKMLAALSFVNAIVLFEEDTPENIIRTIIPDILVKGQDYHPDDIAGAKIVRSNNGQVVTIPLLKGFSTSRIIDKIKKIGDDETVS